jgi:hypothetical protein
VLLQAFGNRQAVTSRPWLTSYLYRATGGGAARLTSRKRGAEARFMRVKYYLGFAVVPRQTSSKAIV